jgi:hypothetical protein
MTKRELTGRELHELRDIIGNVPEKAKPTLTETSTPLSVREPDNNPAEFGPIRPTKPPYPDTTTTPKEPNTRPAKQQRAFKPSRGEN